MNELIKNALIKNIYMMQDIDITSIHECKWIVSEQNYDMHIIHHSTKTYPRMKQMRIKIQLEFHQEIANITLLCPFIFPLNLAICCVTSLVNRPAELHKARPWPAPSPRRHVYPSPSCGNCASCQLLTLLEVDSDAAEWPSDGQETQTWWSDTLYVRSTAHCTSTGRARATAQPRPVSL
jgi:hypothetical protein